ncbi:hypothetical protein B296_00044713 [Ensete ventricosum]|uniref:Uncharacterized protein n=1 Tax=Ensete ventricosum TaxID=4639 RepID=A0A426XFP2_ENSVE|nr:hypothetical protein B296_00044713 [Ensete ventricosum]
MIGCCGRDWFEPDRKSDFAIELARQSGRLRELPGLGVVCLDLASEAEKSLARDDERSRVERGPVCAGSPAVVSAQRWSSVEWEEPTGPAWEVGCLSGGAQVGWKCFSSGRPSIPARRSGRVGSLRDPSDGQVSFIVDFVIPRRRRDAGAFIAIVMGYLYLKALSFLLLTIPLHLTMPSVVLVARRVPAVGGCRPCPPYLC